MSAKTFDQLKTDLEKTKTILEAKNETELKRLTREQLLGDMFVSGIQGYYAQYISQSRIMSQQVNINHLAMPIIGTFGYEPHQRTFFGLNRGIEAHGMYMNVYVANVVQAKNGEKNQNVAFMQQTGMLSSSLEHAVPEQMFTDPNETDPTKRPNGFSAVKALSIAAAQGQRIYTITPATQNTALPNIRLDATSMSEIRAALASGKHVTTHTDLLTVPGFKGAGYVILDPDTGAGIYKISGGKNGGYVGIAVGTLIGTMVLLMVMTGGMATPAVAAFAPFFAAMMAFFAGVMIALTALDLWQGKGNAAECFVAGFIFGLTTSLAFLGTQAGVSTLVGQIINLLGLSSTFASWQYDLIDLKKCGLV